jgi:hypothetical protein
LGGDARHREKWKGWEIFFGMDILFGDLIRLGRLASGKTGDLEDLTGFSGTDNR